eukprot:2811476-Prymnesium_polylepis.1
MDTYPETSLPLASREDSNRPLTGAVPAPADYVIPGHAKVCCRPHGQKGAPQDWILGTVLRYHPQQAKYVVQDDDLDEAGILTTGAATRTRTASRPSRVRRPAPLPLAPSHMPHVVEAAASRPLGSMSVVVERPRSTLEPRT